MDDDSLLVSSQDYVAYICKRQGWDPEEVTLSPTVVIATPFFLEVFKRMAQTEKIDKTIIRNHHKVPALKTSLVEARVGAPLMAMDTEIIIALGGLRIIHLAFAGGIRENIVPGDIIITKGALNETGIPRLYGFDDPLIPPDSALTDALVDAAKKGDIPIRSGLHWCTDAPYRETWGKVKKYRKEGALCVEMEGTALFSVSTYYNVAAAAVYVITDIVGKKGWEQSWHSTNVLEGCKRVITFASSVIQHC
jgi:uridine phosphorylase